MIIPASYAAKKVNEGSKNMFAYVLLSFTLLLGVSYLGLSFFEAFRRELVLPARTYYSASQYGLQISLYLQFISALQGWIFGICYLKSAIASSI